VLSTCAKGAKKTKCVDCLKETITEEEMIFLLITFDGHFQFPLWLCQRAYIGLYLLIWRRTWPGKVLTTVVNYLMGRLEKLTVAMNN